MPRSDGTDPSSKSADDDEHVEFGLEPAPIDTSESRPARIEATPDGDVFDLADPAPVPVGVVNCPKCRLIVRADAGICTRCGAAISAAETTVSAARKAALAESRPCLKCGYEMRGLPHGRCPECGAAMPTGRRARDERLGILEHRAELRRALLLGGSLTLVLAVVVTITDGWLAPIIFIGGAAVWLAVASGTAWLLSLTLLELDDPWALTTARIFAAQVVANASMVVLAMMCPLATLAVVAIYIIALSVLLGLDALESIILGVATLVAPAAVMLVIAVAF